jgi:hypothetical protein
MITILILIFTAFILMATGRAWLWLLLARFVRLFLTILLFLLDEAQSTQRKRTTNSFLLLFNPWLFLNSLNLFLQLRYLLFFWANYLLDLAHFHLSLKFHLL